MISLLIDTSSINLLVAIVKDGDILSFSKIEELRSISTELLVEIKTSLEKNHLAITDIDTIFIVNGPGSFTGLRVGVAVAKTIAYTLHKKIIPISSLELMATTSFEKEYIVPYVDARRGYVYAGIYDKNLKTILKDSYIKVDDLLNFTKNKDVIFTGYSEVIGITSYIKPKENIIKIIEKYKDSCGMNPHELNPNYLKKTEAEEKNGS